MADNSSPLDTALASVEREDLKGAAGATAAGDGDAFAAPPPPPAETERKPGRPRNPNSRRSRAGRYGAGAAPPSTAASGPVSDPPPKPKFEPIDPSAVAQSIVQIDAIIVKAFGTQPLTPDEAKGGGQVFAPVLDHYMPQLAEKGGMWIAPLTWVILAYGPRAYEILDARQKAAEAKRNGWTQGAQSSENGTGRFPAAAESAAQ